MVSHIQVVTRAICDEIAKEKVVLDQSYRDSNVVVF